MPIYLVQHGQSVSKDVDPQKGLSDSGIGEVRRIAEVARNYGIKVDRILHSGKKRAQQTAEIFATALAPAQGVTVAEGLNPMDDVISAAPGIENTPHSMWVGHLPFMERLTSYLITGAIDPPVFQFQNGGIVCLDHYRDSDRWAVKWALMPHIG